MPRPSEASRKVLLIEDRPVLTEAVARLLLSELDLEVSGLTGTDERAFVEAVERLQPEVVVLIETPSLGPARLFQLLQALPVEQALRAIVVHQDNQPLDVFDRQRVMPAGSRDIVRLIAGSPA
jgi:DNA-binding NarL/FixJ family response regulator